MCPQLDKIRGARDDPVPDPGNLDMPIPHQRVDRQLRPLHILLDQQHPADRGAPRLGESLVQVHCRGKQLDPARAHVVGGFDHTGIPQALQRVFGLLAGPDILEIRRGHTVFAERPAHLDLVRGPLGDIVADSGQLERRGHRAHRAAGIRAHGQHAVDRRSLGDTARGQDREIHVAGGDLQRDIGQGQAGRARVIVGHHGEQSHVFRRPG